MLAHLEAVNTATCRYILDGTVGFHRRIDFAFLLEEFGSVTPTKQILITDTFTTQFQTFLHLDVLHCYTIEGGKLCTGADTVDILKSHIGMTGFEVSTSEKRIHRGFFQLSMDMKPTSSGI